MNGFTLFGSAVFDAVFNDTRGIVRHRHLGNLVANVGQHVTNLADLLHERDTERERESKRESMKSYGHFEESCLTRCARRGSVKTLGRSRKART